MVDCVSIRMELLVNIIYEKNIVNRFLLRNQQMFILFISEYIKNFAPLYNTLFPLSLRSGINNKISESIQLSEYLRSMKFTSIFIIDTS